ncbi:MAG: chemotaxis protein CheW [Burkholderiaceae bacterium]|jgi:purine-binding chemotaxis protein CheW
MTKSQAATASVFSGRNEFLTFKLGEEDYGIDILKVKEIRSRDLITRIANAPKFIRGILNLRGTIIPIIDLRIKFGLESSAQSDLSVVIVLQLEGQTVGVGVDSVSDVVGLSAEEILPAPEFGSMLDTRYICGIATIEGRMLILMDIEKVFSALELTAVEDATPLAETA